MVREGYYEYDIKRFSFLQAHHFYWGLCLLVFGFYLLFNFKVEDWIVYTSIGLGLHMIVDDIVQHLIQRSEIENKGYYNSYTFWNWFPYMILDFIKRVMGY